MEEINLEELNHVIGGAVAPGGQNEPSSKRDLSGGSMFRNVSSPGSTYGDTANSREMVKPGSPGFRILPHVGM
jgi:bacteriocin-like protein